MQKKPQKPKKPKKQKDPEKQKKTKKPKKQKKHEMQENNRATMQKAHLTATHRDPTSANQHVKQQSHSQHPNISTSCKETNKTKQDSKHALCQQSLAPTHTHTNKHRNTQQTQQTAKQTGRTNKQGKNHSLPFANTTPPQHLHAAHLATIQGIQARHAGHASNQGQRQDMLGKTMQR